MKKFFILVASVFMLSCASEADKALSAYESAVNEFVKATKSKDKDAVEKAMKEGKDAHELCRKAMESMDSTAKVEFKNKMSELDKKAKSALKEVE